MCFTDCDLIILVDFFIIKIKMKKRLMLLRNTCYSSLPVYHFNVFSHTAAIVKKKYVQYEILFS